ncbi:MAG TPA: hypothetical protein VK864_05950, partial [Longimicrobiales bacterium]|nr:hypothetical protein [Longimicrobiales bacterium]
MMHLKTALLLSLLMPTLLNAQGVRINGVSTARYIEIRPYNLETDTPSVYAPLGLVPLTQDLHLNAWGLGQGIRLYAHVRARASVGDAQGLWPQADDAFDALSAYLEVDRRFGRARLGRQWTSSHLGFYNFDGGALLVRPWNWLTAEIYGG